MSWLPGPTRWPELLFWPAVAVRFGYMAARAERTLLLALRTEFADVMFETLFSFASRTASVIVMGWNVVSVAGCCAPSHTGAASSGINFLNIAFWAPWLVRPHAVI